MCDLCGKCIHTDCASIGETQYENLKESPLPWYCPYCIMELPFFTVKNNDLQKLLSQSHNNHPNQIPRKMNKKIKEFLKKFREMSQIFEQSENPLSCDYYDISDFKKLKINKQQDLSILHLNISSISAHIDDLRTFLNLAHHKFDIICISESRISLKHPQTTNIDLPGFNMEQTPTESSAGGTLIYISQSLSYKPRKDLQIYCPKELESTFIELLIPNRQSHLIGVVYKHPSMKHDKFNNDFRNDLLEKLTSENKPSIITGDFNLDLIKYMQNTGINQFLENILSNSFIPQITLPQGSQKKQQH